MRQGFVAVRLALALVVALSLGPSAWAQDYALFPRTRALTTNPDGRPVLLDVLLLIARDGTVIVKHRETQDVYFQIAPQTVQAMSVEVSSVVGDWGVEDAYWLFIGYDSGGRQDLILKLDRREVDPFVQATPQRMGRTVDLLLDQPGPVVPTKGSQDVDQVVDYPFGRVVEALEPALARYQCRPDGAPSTTTEVRETRCRRPEASAGTSPTGPGNEEVTILLQSVDPGRTRVVVTTDRGTQILARNRMKQNWSTPIFAELARRLEGRSDVASAVTSGIDTATTPLARLARATQSAAVREAFERDSAMLTQLVPGEIVEILDERDDSYLVRPPDGDRSRGWQTGWISKTAVVVIRGLAWPN